MEHLTDPIREQIPTEETTPAAPQTDVPVDTSCTDTPPTPPDTPAEDLPPAPERIDYELLAASDLSELRRLVPSLSHINHIGELPGATRYAELRDNGLSVEEAFWAACHTSVTPATPPYDNRSHLHSAVPRGASANPAVMTAAELHAAKELFEDLTESEIQKLYAKCRA